MAFERDPAAEGFLIGVQGEIVFWVGTSFVIYLIGRGLLGSTATYGQVLRPLGFAAVPGLLILLAAVASLVGAQVVVFAVLVPWRLATSFVAVDRALGVGRAKSAVALLLGVVCGLVFGGGRYGNAAERADLSQLRRITLPRTRVNKGIS